MSTVVVACGGRSLERQISLDSGRRAARALTRLGHQVRVVDVDQSFVDQVEEVGPDFVFVAMHGVGGEDGTLQDLLEVLEVPYTGSDALASALCLDKHLFKTVCTTGGVATPPWHSFTKQAFADYGAGRALDRIVRQFPDGLVVKPAQQGSSLGISVVHDEAELRHAVLEAMSYGDRVLLERFVPGTEVAVTVVGPAAAPQALPIVELQFDEEIYSYSAHYTIGSATVVAPDLSPEQERQVRETAIRAYEIAGCRDFARVDLRLEGDTPWVLEINTIPGLTETGPAPIAAELAGMTFDEFIAGICRRVQADQR